MTIKSALSLILTLALIVIAVAPGYCAGKRQLTEPSGIADGPGIWMNLWSYPKGDMNTYCINLHNHGVRNVFVQTSRSNTEAIRNPETLGRLIETCHKYKIRVIAWSFSMLGSPIADADKLIAAARFKTRHGHTFDAVAANLEKDLTAWKVEKYSQHLRKTLGTDYPLVAVVFSPLNKAPQVAKTPWKLLDKYYDVIAPMAYWNSKYRKFDAYNYTVSTVNRIRHLVGRPDVEVHVIGDGMKTHAPEIKQFLKGCRDSGVASASLYPYHFVTPEQYKCLSYYFEYIPVNSRFMLATFRQLLKDGAFPGVGLNPSKSISRGEFLQLIAGRLAGKPVQSSTDAIKILADGGVLSSSQATGSSYASAVYQNGPVGHKEAYMLVARLVEAKGKTPLAKRAKRVDKWLVPEVNARTIRSGRFKPLSYLDAARIVVSASSISR